MVSFSIEGHGLQGLKMAQNSSKWLKIVAHGFGIAGHAWAWLGMAGHGWAWLGMAGYGWVWATILSSFELF